MLTFNVPIVFVNENKISEITNLHEKQLVIVTEDAAKRIVKQYNDKPEEIAPVKIGSNTIAMVRSLFYDEKRKCIVANIILPFSFAGAIHPLKELQLGRIRRVIDGKLVAVKMSPEKVPTKQDEKDVKKGGNCEV